MNVLQQNLKVLHIEKYTIDDYKHDKMEVVKSLKDVGVLLFTKAPFVRATQVLQDVGQHSLAARSVFSLLPLHKVEKVHLSKNGV